MLSYDKIGTFNGVDIAGTYAACIRVCPNQVCKGVVLTIEVGGEVVEIEPPQLLDFNPRESACTLSLYSQRSSRISRGGCVSCGGHDGAPSARRNM
jgi:ferredoxin